MLQLDANISCEVIGFSRKDANLSVLKRDKDLAPASVR